MKTRDIVVGGHYRARNRGRVIVTAVGVPRRYYPDGGYHAVSKKDGIAVRYFVTGYETVVHPSAILSPWTEEMTEDAARADAVTAWLSEVEKALDSREDGRLGVDGLLLGIRPHTVTAHPTGTGNIRIEFTISREGAEKFLGVSLPAFPA